MRRRKIRQKRFVLDGEAVILGFDGVSDFDALHSRKHDHEVQFCAFDIRAGRRDDLRKLPLSLRKTNLERLLDRPYQAGRSKHWIKVKNRTHPAMSREM